MSHQKTLGLMLKMFLLFSKVYRFWLILTIKEGCYDSDYLFDKYNVSQAGYVFFIGSITI